MTPSPGYAARVAPELNTPENAKFLGILQGRGVDASKVTRRHIAAARADYQQRYDAERARRERLGIPLGGNIPGPGEPPVVSVKPPWEV